MSKNIYLKDRTSADDELDRLRTRDQRFVVFGMLCIVSFINVFALAILPFYALYKNFLEKYPYMSRFELFSVIAPICVGVSFGMVVMTALSGYVLANIRVEYGDVDTA